MAEESQTIRSIHWRELFPFVNLFRAFRVAIHPSKLVLAMLALLLIYCGGRVLDAVWADKYKAIEIERAAPTEVEIYWTAEKGYTIEELSTRAIVKRVGVFDTFFRHEVASTSRPWRRPGNWSRER